LTALPPVLVVDDEVIIRMGTTVLLRALGYDVVEASGGNEALEIVRARADLSAVITDYEMPNGSGLELARAARHLRPGLAIVVATGKASVGDELDADWVPVYKPYTTDDLAAALRMARTAVAPALAGERDQRKL
jgi:CheY-like chemotaxis protein